MKNVKQTIIVRKDLKLPKSKTASLVAHASMKFLFENNESERNDEIHVKLSHQEAEWTREKFSRSVVSVDSQESLKDVAFRAEMSGLDVYYVFKEKQESDDLEELIAIAIGPDDEDLLDQVSGNLKSI
jgi:PTH2 family peptidyl-tRNA hydrolase